MEHKNFIHFDFMLQGFLQVSVIFVCFYVTVTLWWLDKLLVTLKTFVWHFPRVNPFVSFHRAALWKRFAAVGTMKWHISCVISCVYLEFFLLPESFVTMQLFVRFWGIIDALFCQLWDLRMCWWCANQWQLSWDSNILSERNNTRSS